MYIDQLTDISINHASPNLFHGFEKISRQQKAWKNFPGGKEPGLSIIDFGAEMRPHSQCQKVWGFFSIADENFPI